MTTIVRSNGSRWLGQAPATLEELYEVLKEHPLTKFATAEICEHEDSGFAGRFVKFWGNFEDISHVFDVDTDDPAVEAELFRLFKANRKHPPKGLKGDAVNCRCRDAHFGKFNEEGG